MRKNNTRTCDYRYKNEMKDFVFKQDRLSRILDMYTRFTEGKILFKIEEAQKFGVDTRTIQRDIDAIRAFLDNRRIIDATDFRSIKYDHIQKGFYMTEEADDQKCILDFFEYGSKNSLVC